MTWPSSRRSHSSLVDRLRGLGQDAGSDDGGLAVLRDREPLLVALETDGALVDAGGQRHAAAELGRARHGDQRRAAVDAERLPVAAFDEEVAVVEGQRRLAGAVDGDGRPGPHLDLGVVGQLEGGAAVDHPDLVAGRQGAPVRGPDERRAGDRHFDHTGGVEASGAFPHLGAVHVVDAGHDEAGHHDRDDGARQRGDDGAVQGAHVSRPPLRSRCPGHRP
jgi:hypothetical protein